MPRYSRASRFRPNTVVPHGAQNRKRRAHGGGRGGLAPPLSWSLMGLLLPLASASGKAVVAIAVIGAVVLAVIVLRSDG